MPNNLKKILIAIGLIGYFNLFNNFEFHGLRAVLLDLTQIVFNSSGKDTQLVTFNIKTPSSEFTRPLNHSQIERILNKIAKGSPKNIILMISPKELVSNSEEKLMIRRLFDTYDNLYLFSPYTNGPLGGFKADTIFETYPRHFSMPFTKDTLFGAKDSKVRRAIISYQNKGEEPFIKQLRDMALTSYTSDDFKNYFQLWDTKQIQIKTKKLGSFGFIDLQSSNDDDIKSIIGKSVLIGTFDEFSIHVSPSIFDLKQKLEKDNFNTYFFPVTETAANIIYAYSTKDYIKLFELNDLFIFPVIFIVLLLLPMGQKLKGVLCLGFIPIMLGFVFLIYFIGSTYIDATKSLVSIFLLQYFGMPIYFYFAFKNQEEKKYELINQTRADSFLSVAEKVAHDIRSPLSSIKLLISKMKSEDPDIPPLISESLNRIDGIAQDILKSTKSDLSNKLKTFEPVNLNELISALIKEKEILNSNISYKITSAFLSNFALGNKIEIERVVSNILDNSIAALKNIENPRVDIYLDTQADKCTLEIIDNGKGIDLNLLSILGKFKIDKNIFDKQSNGLGVVHSKRVIEKLGGNFEINNNKNQIGANVKISLKSFSTK